MKVLIVEDEFLVAATLEDILLAAGHDVIGIATDRPSAEQMAADAELAFVDLNLRDGLTGPHIARTLSQVNGATIVYVTANPNQIGEPAPSAVGYVEKPFLESAILSTVNYVASGRASPPPPSLKLLADC